MPYDTAEDLPQTVRDKLRGKKLRQWMHVWNSAYASHGDESRAFAEAWATVKKGAQLCSISSVLKRSAAGGGDYGLGSAAGKASDMNDFTFFMPIAKLNKDKRTVSGYASTPTRDSDGEIVTLEAVKDALPDYMNWRNVREMHALKAIGTAEEADLDHKGLYLTAKIVDDGAWKKCLEGVYKGFSIGGRKLAKDGDKITKLEMTEISVVDRPANPDCRISIAKSAAPVLGSEGHLLLPKAKPTAEAKAMAKMAKIVADLAKANPPAARDGLSLPAPVEKENSNYSPKDEDNQNNKVETPEKEACKTHGVIDCPKCSVEKKEFSEDKRRELASSGAALPDGSYPIENLSDLRNAIQAFGRAKDKGKAKAHIKRRARALGATDQLPEDWGKSSKKYRKVAAARLNDALGLGAPSFLTLDKGMRTTANLAYCFDSLRDAQRSLMLEGKAEGGDKKDQALAKQLGSLAKDLANIIGQKAAHEAQEAEDMSDVDDAFVTQLLGEPKMATAKGEAAVAVSNDEDISHGDALTDALAQLMKRASAPTRGQRLDMAAKNVKECRKAMKECRKAIEEAHKMHKAAFLAKAAKRDKKPDDDDDDGDFDHAGAMEKLQKAYGSLDKARTFGKAAIGNIAKAQGASGRAGQRGQEVTDGEGKFYEVPPGLRSHTPADLATTSPGGQESGSQPPLYPADGSVYPGKAAGLGDLAKYAKDGKIPADVVELIVKGAKAEAELAALKKLPATPSGGRRPFNFDLTKVTAGNSPRELGSVLFDGVDTNALNSGDEQAHTEATARVIGNFITSGQFGKSVFDPMFKGAAGSAR